MIKRFDGANWVGTSTHRRWDGSNWVDCSSSKRWDGANWVECLMTEQKFFADISHAKFYVDSVTARGSVSYGIENTFDQSYNEYQDQYIVRGSGDSFANINIMVKAVMKNGQEFNVTTDFLKMINCNVKLSVEIMVFTDVPSTTYADGTYGNKFANTDNMFYSQEERRKVGVAFGYCNFADSISVNLAVSTVNVIAVSKIRRLYGSRCTFKSKTGTTQKEVTCNF